MFFSLVHNDKLYPQVSLVHCYIIPVIVGYKNLITVIFFIHSELMIYQI